MIIIKYFGFLLLVLFVTVLFLIVHFATTDYDRCYSEMEYAGHASQNCCHGSAGGTINTHYLSETCVSCPYLKLPDTTEKKEG